MVGCGQICVTGPIGFQDLMIINISGKYQWIPLSDHCHLSFLIHFIHVWSNLAGVHLVMTCWILVLSFFSQICPKLDEALAIFGIFRGSLRETFYQELSNMKDITHLVRTQKCPKTWPLIFFDLLHFFRWSYHILECWKPFLCPNSIKETPAMELSESKEN